MAPAAGEWRSLVAHLLWEQRVAGSNPVSPTIAGPVTGPDQGAPGRTPARGTDRAAPCSGAGVWPVVVRWWRGQALYLLLNSLS